ncbi:MAG: SUF system NifU family Fe-S cluster assembly protein [Thaumarchaeota archaeon]|nr:SUF system NifU family Fe-S cluster assembly protein [Nitrososphaerota archaeon]
MYAENILDHYKSPRNYGKLKNPTVTYKDSNPLCGDEVVIQVELTDNKIADIAFSGRGCAISQASTSMLTEAVKGKNIDELKKLDQDYIVSILGISIGPTRMKCALLGLRTLQKGVWGVNVPGVARLPE